MPHFTVHISQQGPIVDAAVLVSSSRQTVLKQLGQAVPKPQNVRALLDTGASGTCVDPNVLNALGLTPTGETLMLTPSTGSTPQKALTYDVQIGIFAGRPNDLHYISETIQVMASDLFAAQGIHVLIGRDVLSSCILHYNGADGILTLAY